MAHPRNKIHKVSDAATLFKSVQLFYEYTEITKSKTDRIKLKDMLLTLLNKELSEVTLETVSMTLMRTVLLIDNYTFIKTSAEKIIARKGVPKKVLKHVYRDAAHYAIINNDPKTSKKKIEEYYELSVVCGCEDFTQEIHGYLARYYFADQKFVDAIPHLEKLITSKQLSFKLMALGNLGICFHMTNKLTEAQQCYEKVVAIYEADPSLDQKHHEMVSNCAHNCAKLLDNYDGDIASDPEKAVRYYHIGAKLNNRYSLHDLGFKYDNGEDVLADVNKAIYFYRKALALGNKDSLINLFIILQQNHKNYSNELQQLKKMKDHPNVNTHLCHHYILEFRTIMRSDNPDSAANISALQECGKLAFQYGKLAVATGSGVAELNMGALYHYGVGVEKSFSRAEQYYLSALKRGYKGANRNLSALYNDKLQDSCKSSIAELETTSTPALAGRPRDEILKELFKRDVELQSTRINTDLISVVHDPEIENEEKILILLDHKIENLETTNLPLLINRLGVLTEKSLTRRDFHNSQLAKIREFLNEVELKLDLQAFDTAQLTSLIEGVSKLYLQAQAIDIGKLASKLYLEVMRLILEFDVKQLISIFYAASRLDFVENIFKDYLPKIITHLMSKKDDFDLYDFSKCIYAAALLNNSQKNLIGEDVISVLLDVCVSIFENKGSAKIKKQMDDPELIFVRQVYMASFYFSKKYPTLSNETLLSSIAFWKAKLAEVQANFKISYFQDDVTHFIRQYYPEYQKEYVVNSLSVDVYIQISETKGFILQADGPSHFLHDIDAVPKPTQKAQFRDAFLRFDHDVICVAYHEWGAVTQRQDYIATLLREINITLEDKWILPKNYPKTLFQQSDSKSPSTPTPTSPRANF
jgi:TPR repeat protein/sulfur relay (sulfurtransferase) DsrC/TusE family protein